MSKSNNNIKSLRNEIHEIKAIINGNSSNANYFMVIISILLVIACSITYFKAKQTAIDEVNEAIDLRTEIIDTQLNSMNVRIDSVLKKADDFAILLNEKRTEIEGQILYKEVLEIIERPKNGISHLDLMKIMTISDLINEKPEEDMTADDWYIRAFVEDDEENKIELYTKAIEEDPEFAHAIAKRAHYRVLTNDFEGFFEDYAKTLEFDLDSIDLHLIDRSLTCFRYKFIEDSFFIHRNRLESNISENHLDTINTIRQKFLEKVLKEKNFAEYCRDRW